MRFVYCAICLRFLPEHLIEMIIYYIFVGLNRLETDNVQPPAIETANQQLRFPFPMRKFGMKEEMSPR